MRIERNVTRCRGPLPACRSAAIASLILLGLALSGCVWPTGSKPRPVAVADPPPSPSPPPVASAPPTHDAHKLRVLFVGNSLTGANDLPGMLASLAAAANDTVTIEVGRDVVNGTSLLDHLGDGTAQTMIATGTWDVVVLQQGPSSLPASRTELLSSTRSFADLIEAHGARTALYMVWPEKARIGVLDEVIASYTLAAQSVSGLLIPAGLAWKFAWAEDPAFPLYSSDDFHPSPLGTYVAALCCYGALRARAATGLPTRFNVGGTLVEIPAAQAALAQRAADQALGAGTAP